MIHRQPADLQGVMDHFEGTRDVVVLVVQNKAQDVEKRMQLRWAEVSGLINEDAELSQQHPPEMQLGGGSPRLKGGPGPFGQPRVPE